jgi:3-dehydroquinate dehydratase-2
MTMFDRSQAASATGRIKELDTPQARRLSGFSKEPNRMISILVLNGPNLNLLGTRQPEVYGRVTLGDIEAMCRAHAAAHDTSLGFAQSNHEGVLIDEIHAARGLHDGIILNAGAFTHTSLALMDALCAVEIPAIELHLSNVHAREDFRHVSYVARVAVGVICGFGAQGYILALDAMRAHLAQLQEPRG